MTTINLALDWTPNVNHIGFLIAKELGYYEEVGIDLNILNPIEDNYSITPGKKLELGLADFAIAPSETVISLNNKSNPVSAIAVFAILQNDLSKIVTLKSSGISSPKHLNGRSYASYKARYEDHIIKEMIKNDGGNGDLDIMYPEKLGIWNTLLTGQADSTWIFDNWEGVEAQDKNVDLYKFSLQDFNIPYGYSPIIITKTEYMEKNMDVARAFVKATKKGFLHVQKNIAESAAILRQFVAVYDLKNINLEASLSITAPHFGDEISCGIMNETKVYAFLQWLVERELENKVIMHQQLFTNKLLEE
jgi:ABC-type nitrate/sulfonate/bicarbonate transport system substrate-binding protein